jgi:type I restriction enzyme, S subunit
VSAPAHWPTVPLGDAFFFQEGPGVRNWQFTTSGIKLLNVANIEKSGTLNLAKTDRHLDEAEVAKKYSHFLVDAGDLVIASSGISFDDDGLLRTRGAFVAREHLPLCLNTSTIRFKAVDQVSDLRYLRLWLNGIEFRSQITKLVTGTAQQNFGPSHLKATKITLPPLPEQRRIAEVLDRAEALRAKRRAALAQLDTLTQSIFLDLFGDPVTNPKGWPISTIGEVAEVQGGLQVTSVRKSCPREVPYLRVANVYRGYLDLSEIKTIRATDAEIARTTLEKNDLLVVEGHGNPAEIGRGALWDGSIAGCVHQNHIIRARFRAGKIVPLYVCEYFNSPGGRRHLLRAGKTTSGLNTISVSDVRGTPVALPPLGLQSQFASNFAAVDKLKSAHRASLAKLDALFASLQHRAFRGAL